MVYHRRRHHHRRLLVVYVELRMRYVQMLTSKEHAGVEQVFTNMKLNVVSEKHEHREIPLIHLCSQIAQKFHFS